MIGYFVLKLQIQKKNNEDDKIHLRTIFSIRGTIFMVSTSRTWKKNLKELSHFLRLN